MTQSAADNAQIKRQKLAEMLRKRSLQPKDMPLSIGQERLYRLARLNPDVPLYNVAAAYRISGPVDAAALEQAVHGIEARHEILRTTFPMTDDGPVQRIAPAVAPEAGRAANGGGVFALIDLGGGDGGDLPAAAMRVIEAEVGRTIDIVTGPLWRVALIRLGPDDHALTLTMHHIVSDGWSFEVFLTELAARYGALTGTGAATPEPLPIQYAAFGERQRAALSAPDIEGQQAYWRAHLDGTIPPLLLPVDRDGRFAGGDRDGRFGGGDPDAPADHDSRAAASVPIALSQDLSQALDDLGRAEGATLFMTLLTGFEALLHRSCGQEDMLLCTPVAGRHRAQSRELIGYFNNILPMRADLSGDPSLQDLLRRTRVAALGAFKNQDVPFLWNADLPALRRISLSRLLFSLDMEWPPRLALPGTECAPIATDTGAADFDLSVSLWKSGGQVKGALRYKPSLFDRATAAALAEGYAALLAIMAETPERTLSSLPRAVPAKALADPAPAAPAAAAPEDDDPAARLPRSALELRLAREWEAVFERRPIGIHDDLRALGASSLAVANLAERIQTAFSTDLSITAIFQAGTVARMAALLQSRDAGLVASPLAPIQPHGAKTPLFLCEGVGIYYPLAPYLGEDRPIYGLVTEIAGDHPRVEDLAAHYLSAVLEAQPEGPYHLGGISFGGLVAFEMAQQLHAMGREVGVLALLDTPGPGAFRPKPLLGRLVGHAGNLLRHGLPYLRAKLERRSRMRGDGRGEAVGAGSASRLTGAEQDLRNLFERSAALYEIKPYAGHITLFTLAHRSAMSDSLIDPGLAYVDPLLGWGAVAAQGVERVALAGEHVTILREPFVRPLGERLRELLDQAPHG